MKSKIERLQFMASCIYISNMCPDCKHVGSGHTQAISDTWITVQKVFGCFDEDVEFLSAVLCALHQT